MRRMFFKIGYFGKNTLYFFILSTSQNQIIFIKPQINSYSIKIIIIFLKSINIFFNEKNITSLTSNPYIKFWAML
jgi:hypothetical protein